MDNLKKIIWARRGIFWAALLGLFASAYLLYTYSTGSNLVCGSLVHGCDAVRASKWSAWFGIPTPLFGVLFYLTVIILAIIRSYSPDYKPKLARLAQIILASAGFLESLVLTSIQTFIIGQYCSWCLASALAATLIFIFTLFDRNYTLEKMESMRELKITGISLAVFLVAGGTLFFWLIRPIQTPPINSEFNQGRIPSITPPVIVDPNLNQSTGTNE